MGGRADAVNPHCRLAEIGKVFKQFGDKEESLRQATLTAIKSIGRLAVQESADHVLVAGDVFDNKVPTEVTLRAPLERIKLFPQVKWHFLPGNHDPHRPQGLWERLTRLGCRPMFTSILRLDLTPCCCRHPSPARAKRTI